jgi:hypothetical protein
VTALPDFFIVGAPKCATTSLAHYLDQHPELGISRRKDHPLLLEAEPGTLSGDPLYRSFFAGLEGKRRIGDASVWSLYSRRALENIAGICERPQIIVSLRAQEEMLPSLHAQRISGSGAPAQPFERAWRAEQEGRPLRWGSLPDPPGTYRAAGSYSEHLRAYVEAFGRDSLLVLGYEELRRDPVGAAARVYRFLGADPGFLPQTPVLNARHRPRVRWLRRAVNEPPAALRWTTRGLLGQSRRGRLAAWLMRVNRTGAAPEPISESLRAELREEFAPDRRLLDELFGGVALSPSAPVDRSRG